VNFYVQSAQVSLANSLHEVSIKIITLTREKKSQSRMRASR
jgi:hypothetical protein